MSDFEAILPAYFVVSRKLDEEQLNFVNHAFRITPITAVIITDVYDNELALRINQIVVRVVNIAAAHAVAMEINRETGERVAIIGEADLIENYDEEGNRQLRQERPEDSSSTEGRA